MLPNTFRSFNIAVQFHKLCEQLKLAGYLKSQLLRASSSVVLNLAEGSAKPTVADRQRFYAIAFGSLRECQAILALAPKATSDTVGTADHLGACLYKLTRSQVST